jgi:hypothetical protein
MGDGSKLSAALSIRFLLFRVLKIIYEIVNLD